MALHHKLYEFCVQLEDLVDIYVLYIRSLSESSATVWHSSLTQGQEMEIKRVQKVRLRIILKYEYDVYDNALNVFSLKTLKERREVCALHLHISAPKM